MEKGRELIFGVLTLKPEYKQDEETWSFTWEGDTAVSMVQKLSFSWESMEDALEYLTNNMKAKEFEKIELKKKCII